jgi:amidase
MQRSRTVNLVLAAVMLLATVAFTPPGRGAPPPSVPAAAASSQAFTWAETTLDDVRTALVTRRISCRELIEGYLDRIDAYDRQGPNLQSVIAVNPAALDQADALDAKIGVSRGANTGRLHCVPVLVKDNIDVAGMPTTAGSSALAESVPPDDAFIIEQLRAEDAIVLAKVNLDEWAFGFGGASELGGRAQNPYGPAYGAGGSSSGTGVSVSASLGMLGIGTDTGGSIRVPSSANGLVGIRPSMRLLSQDGIIPLALFQDTAGPMCRTVQDCAVMLDVMAGFDSGPYSGQYTLPLQRDDLGVLIGSPAEFDSLVGTDDTGYAAALDPNGLAGARVGVVRELFGNNADVAAAMNAAIAAMESAGAIVEDVTIPDRAVILSNTFQSMSGFEFYDQLNRYLQSWPLEEGDTRPWTYEEVQSLVSGTGIRNSFAQRRTTGLTRFDNPTYARNTLERPDYVRTRLLAALENTDLEGNPLGAPYDALLYPAMTGLPTASGGVAAGTNNRISPYTGFPALTMPAAYTTATETRPALPVGMELLGREFDEGTLLRLAYGYQSVVEGTPLARQAPTTSPELPVEPVTRPVPPAGPVGIPSGR